MGAGHDHGAGSANASALTKALALTGIFLIAEVVGALLTGSLALLSDAAHMMTDTAGLAIALAAVRIGARPADSKRTFGYKRFEILAAAVNALLLFVVASVARAGLTRLVHYRRQRLTVFVREYSSPQLVAAAAESSTT